MFKHIRVRRGEKKHPLIYLDLCVDAKGLPVDKAPATKHRDTEYTQCVKIFCETTKGHRKKLLKNES